ncbi:MAG TPA: acetyltransferase [Flavobacterium sp.]|jgi:sugar O-acyltransferase (sialic acid O-acetyltransferase NeuD family)|nr:acetyltransferase [Flavobacterium sp.]
MKKKLIIFGITELAQLAHFYFTHDSDFEVVAFTLNDQYIQSDSFLGLPVVPFEDIEQRFPPNDFWMYIAIGYTQINERRKTKYFEAKVKGFRLASYVSSKSTSWPDLEVGDNTLIMEDNTIMPFCKIGSNNLVFVNNIFSHHSVFKDHITLTSHCAIGGNSIIENQAFFGMNCTTRSDLTIGEGSIIGSAANVVKNVEPFSVMIGNPAKPNGQDSRDIKI